MEELEFVDRPSIQISRKESVEMPFRYLVKDGAMVMADGMKALLKKQSGDILAI
jgi:ribosome biogenesis SPOUT family RNA methylase Rps3